MNLIDLTQFVNRLHKDVAKLPKIEYRFGRQFVSNKVMRAILDQFKHCLATAAPVSETRGHTLTLMLSSFLQTLLAINSKTNREFVTESSQEMLELANQTLVREAVQLDLES